MNLIKKWILTSVLVCTTLVLCGIGVAKAQTAPSASDLSYTLVAFDAQAPMGPVTSKTKMIKYAIKIVNHSNNQETLTIKQLPTFCLRGLINDYGCLWFNLNIAPVTVTIGPEGSTTVALPQTVTIQSFIDALNANNKQNHSRLPVPSIPLNEPLTGCASFTIAVNSNAPATIDLCDFIYKN